jgi:hypothetical protein
MTSSASVCTERRSELVERTSTPACRLTSGRSSSGAVLVASGRTVTPRAELEVIGVRPTAATSSSTELMNRRPSVYAAATRGSWRSRAPMEQARRRLPRLVTYSPVGLDLLYGVYTIPEVSCVT